MPPAPSTVIMYPAGGGNPFGICRRRYAKHLVEHGRAEWLFEDHPRECCRHLAIRMLPCGNVRKDFPSVRLSAEEIARAMGSEWQQELFSIGMAPYEGVAGGGSAAGLDEILRVIGPREPHTPQDLVRHWDRVRCYVESPPH